MSPAPVEWFGPWAEDGEIVGVDANGGLLQWNDDDEVVYNCGETPEQFGWTLMRDHEIVRVIEACRIQQARLI